MEAILILLFATPIENNQGKSGCRRPSIDGFQQHYFHLDVLVTFLCIRHTVSMGLKENCSACDTSSYDANGVLAGSQLWENYRKIDDVYKKSVSTITTYDVNMKANNTYMCENTHPKNMTKMEAIILGDGPKRVKNFKCVSMDFNEWKCTFDSREIVSTTYTVGYEIYGHIYEWPCTRTNEHYECKYKQSRNTHDFYKFFVKSQNCFGNRTENFSYNIHKHVIPGDVRLRIKDISSTEVNFTWKIDTNIRNLVMYEVKVNFRVKGFSTPKSAEMWKQVELSFRTNSHKPIKSPTVDRGGFYIDTSNKKCAHIFWRAVTNNKMNGTDFGYKLQINSTSSNETLKHYYNEACGEGDYNILIWSRNSEGLSPIASSIRIQIPGGRRGPRDVKGFSNNKRYILEWRPPDLSQQWDIVDYTISRCTSKTLSFESCENPIQFIRAPANQTKFTFPKRKPDQIFAVSANYKKHSSGMVLPLCIPLETIELEPIVLKNSSITESNVTVEWDTTCEDRTLLTKYSLQYCASDNNKSQCKGAWSTIADIPIDKTTFTLTGLTPYSYYLINAITSIHIQGPINKLLWVQTAEAAPSAPGNLTVCEVFADYAILEWDEPIIPNGIIKFYQIAINGTVVHEGAGNMSFYNLTKLESFETYDVQVNAITMRGKIKLIGKASNTIIRTEGREPGLVTPLTTQPGSSYINISWSEPSETYGPVDGIQYELNYSYGQITESKIMTGQTYKLSCSTNQKLEICVRAIQTFVHSQNCNCRHIKSMSNSSNYYSMYYGNAVCFEGYYCSSNEFHLILFITIFGSTSVILLILIGIFYKHKLMKTIKIVVPQGLDDIYESPREQFSAKSDSSYRMTNAKYIATGEFRTENLKTEDTSSTESPRLHLLRSSVMFMTHTTSDVNFEIQITNEETAIIQESASVLRNSKDNNAKQLAQMTFPTYIDPQSMKSILSLKVPKLQNENELQERKTELQPMMVDDVTKSETKTSTDSCNILNVPNTGYVSLNVTLTPRNNRKAQPKVVEMSPLKGNVGKKSYESWKIVRNTETGYCQVHLTKTLSKQSIKNEFRWELDDIAGSIDSTDFDKSDELDRKSWKHVKQSYKDDLADTKFNGYVTMEDLTLLASHRN